MFNNAFKYMTGVSAETSDFNVTYCCSSEELTTRTSNGNTTCPSTSTRHPNALICENLVTVKGSGSPHEVKNNGSNPPSNKNKTDILFFFICIIIALYY